MALTTYTELKASIADWLNRSDLTAAIPDFISLAEAQMERTLRTRQMIVRANASFNAEYGATPNDFLEVKFRLVPTPDSNYATELTYYAKISKLSASVATNFILESSPDAYLYGSLLQAAPYLQDDNRIQVWASLYERALNDLQVADDRGATSGGALLTRAKTFG